MHGLGMLAMVYIEEYVTGCFIGGADVWTATRTHAWTHTAETQRAAS